MNVLFALTLIQLAPCIGNADTQDKSLNDSTKKYDHLI